jgi:beta-mannosidase
MLRTTYLHSGWEFVQTDLENKKVGFSKTEWLPANVPGHVHLDLMENGIIPDPFERMNELGCQWVDQVDWSYRTTFEWSATEELPTRILRFEGLDTICTVRLNGEDIAQHDNMFVPLEVDVTDRLREGQNELRVDFQSAVRVGDERRAAYFAKEGLDDSVDRFNDRSFVRKAQYMYGWDWGPRLVSCGLWRPVSIVEYANRITDVHVHQEHHEDGSVTLRTTTTLAIEEGDRFGVDAQLFDPEGDLIAEFGAQAEIHIEDPERWHPGQNGEAVFYTLVTRLLDGDTNLEGDTVSDVQITTIGICQTRLLREPDQYGESFEFEVNGQRIWARGANWIPDHSFPAAVTRQRYREQIERAVDMGFNMLRIWGGGLYETDEFYDLCDEMGVLVWQDFPFACAYYPDDEPWQEVIRHEAAVNVRRLRNHACLALWCGNNENQEMFVNQWGGPDAQPPRYYGENHYDHVLPAVVEELDPGRSYIPTSPIGQPPEEKIVDEKRRGPNADGYGDQHNWDVWHGRGDWRNYTDSRGRFSSEYGFASSCCLSVWDKTLSEEDWEVRSPVVRWHDKTGKGYETFVGYTKLHYPDPISLEDWVYYSQLNQRDALRYGVEHYRRSDYCKGSLIWQLNDCWPVQSWAILDSDGNYKALAYELRRLYADNLVSIVRDNDQVSVWVVNDGTEEITGTIELRATELATGRLLGEWAEEFVTAGAGRRVNGLQASVAGLAVPDVLLTATWVGTEAWQLLAEPKAARLPAAEPLVISTSDDGYLTVKTTTPLVDLMLTEEGSPAKFLDNFLTVAEPGVYTLRCDEKPSYMEARSLSGEHRVVLTRSPL